MFIIKKKYFNVKNRIYVKKLRSSPNELSAVACPWVDKSSSHGRKDRAFSENHRWILPPMASPTIHQASDLRVEVPKKGKRGGLLKITSTA